MICPKASRLNHDDFISVYILAQNKENCWNDFANAFKFHKKNPNLFLNWDFWNYFRIYPLNQASFNAFFVASVALSPSFSS